MNPKGPFYKAIAGQNNVPASGNAIAEAVGLPWLEILEIPGQNPVLKNYDPSGPYLVGSPTDPHFGQWLLLPGFPPPVPDTSALEAEVQQARSALTAEQAQVVTLTTQINQLKAQIAQLMSQPASGSAQDSAALDELARALPSLAKALASRAAPSLPAPVGAQTKPLPAVQ